MGKGRYITRLKKLIKQDEIWGESPEHKIVPWYHFVTIERHQSLFSDDFYILYFITAVEIDIPLEK
jgi:hypothetical protein